jgi:hypothetical protein
MNDLTIFLVIATVLSGTLAWLLIPKRKAPGALGTGFESSAKDALSAARHYVHFPQIRQALSRSDERFLMENAPPRVAKRAIRERRAVARNFVKGLHEDFSNLARMGRVIASLSPEISREQETERLLLSLKFQLLYSLVLLRLTTGSMPLEQLGVLTGLVGRLATRMDEAMAEVTALSARPMHGNLGT